MLADDLIHAFALPAESLVGRRIAKDLLTQHAATTAADRRAVAEGVGRCTWVAALKPASAGIPAYRDEMRAYDEIAVLRLRLRGAHAANLAKRSRMIALVHRAIPYPTVLVTTQDVESADEPGDTSANPDAEGEAAPSEVVLSLSFAPIRHALREAERTVLDGEPLILSFEDDEGAALSGFLDALPLSRQPRIDLRACYAGWMNAATALRVSRLSGTFEVTVSAEHAQRREMALAEIERVDAELAATKRAAEREKQIARRADLNMQHARLRARRRTLLSQL